MNRLSNPELTIIRKSAPLASTPEEHAVAPVRIGAGATIGGGSTIVDDVPPGTLTVARSRQVAIPGWQRPRKQPKG